jgi:uncharacterized protein YdeI (YjbR/CyaY-like superfamily)
MKPTFFASQPDFRKWLAANHNRAGELLVGFHRRDSGKGGLSYPEALDEALCFGWIDGVRRRFSASSYSIRFSPRKPDSIWSAVNARRFTELSKQGRIHPAGRKIFERRDKKKSNLYSYERASCQLGSEYEKQFRANKAAWEFYQSQPPGYRRTSCWWVISAKQEATRGRRLATLIADSANGLRIKPLRRPDDT